MAGIVTPFSAHIAAYHSERCRRVAKWLKRVSQIDDEVSIHRARVEIKKIFALSDLIDQCSGNTDSSTSLRPLSRIFKLMGRMRDHSHAMTLCLEYQIDRSILDKEGKSLHRCSKKLRSRIGDMLEEWSKIKKSNTKRLKPITEANWKLYLHNKYDEIARVTGASPTAEELHAIRRSIRQLLCNSQIGGQDHTVVTSADMARLDRLQSDIGDWHDMAVFMGRLRAVGYDTSHPREYAAVRRKEKQLRQLISKNILI